jgi:hypothetical protein
VTRPRPVAGLAVSHTPRSSHGSTTWAALIAVLALVAVLVEGRVVLRAARRNG